MSNRSWGGLVGCVWLLLAGACGQELVLPTGGPEVGNAGAPDDGMTGPRTETGGAAAIGRLPIPDRPSFSTFGGYGGAESDHSDAGDAGRGGSELTPDSDPPSGGWAGDTAVAGGGSMSRGGAAGAGSTAGAAGATPLGGAAGSGSEDLPPQLWFSEYVEGSGSYKALEIYAAAPASLEGCDLETYFNGKTEPARLALHGALEGGAVQVLCSTALAAELPSQCNRTTSLTFNGDDAIALRCAGGALLDVIGEIGVDPGTAWAEGATLDHTLRRRCSVTAGNPAPSPGFEPDAEWQIFGVDSFTDLGRHDCGR